MQHKQALLTPDYHGFLRLCEMHHTRWERWLSRVFKLMWTTPEWKSEQRRLALIRDYESSRALEMSKCRYDKKKINLCKTHVIY